MGLWQKCHSQRVLLNIRGFQGLLRHFCLEFGNRHLGVLVALPLLFLAPSLAAPFRWKMVMREQELSNSQSLLQKHKMGVCSLSENSHQAQVCCVCLDEDLALGYTLPSSASARKCGKISSGQEKRGTLPLLGAFPLQPPK